MNKPFTEHRQVPSSFRQLLSLFGFLCLYLIALPNSVASQIITIAYGDAYKPFAYAGDREAEGIQVDFVEELLVTRLGLTVQHVSCPWKRCQRMVSEGTLDGFFTVPTSERESYTQESEIPFYTTDFVIHVAQKSPVIEQLRKVTFVPELLAMQELRHVFMRGSGWHEEMLKTAQNVTRVADASVIPMMLIQNRADLYIEQAEMFQFQAAQLGLDEQLLTLPRPIIQRVNWHLFISNKSSNITLLPRLNALLATLKESGELEQLQREIFARYKIKYIAK
ncbi:substrate-binding periplasmic protein [Alteromonas flava]|uniref:substrate-binding periplasmic protein n=1 Tax=Alteromonas flava TaxID=2048003 RepID=UPI0013DB6241|nr:transporter substrate-binding domain-containing protein [Alteromonas flava]